MIMYTPIKYQLIVLFCLVYTCFYGQFNTKINTGGSLSTNVGSMISAAPIKRINEKIYKNKLVTDFKNSPIRTMEVPKAYLTKPKERSWKITHARAFGPGNLGFTFQNGQLRRYGFLIEGYFISGEAVKFVANIEFDARKDKTYLIRIKNPGSGISTTSYIYAYAGGILKVYAQNHYYVLLVQAQESGKMSIPISATHMAGGNERYPTGMLIPEILIDQL